MFGVQIPQLLLDSLPRLFSVPSRFEAVPELPRFVVKRRVIPLKNFDAPITQDDEISFVGIRLPAFASIQCLWIVSWHDSTFPWCACSSVLEAVCCLLLKLIIDM